MRFDRLTASLTPWPLRIMTNRLIAEFKRLVPPCPPGATEKVFVLQRFLCLAIFMPLWSRVRVSGATAKIKTFRVYA
jgi:hypothetical protein